MKQKILVEGKYGHGARTSWLQRKAHRVFQTKLARAEIPFDWITGFDIETKVGTIPAKNQFQADSCGGEAGSYFIAAALAFLNGKQYFEQSAKSVYSPIWYPGGGTTVPALEQQIANKGSLDESVLSSYFNNTTTEAFMEDRSWMTLSNLQLAMAKAGWTAIPVTIEINAMAEAIRDYGGIIVEIQGQNNGTWDSTHPNPPVNNQNLWQHFLYFGKAITLNSLQVLGAFNSWGAGIGDNGKQYFTEEYVNSGYMLDVFTFVRNTPTAGYQFTQDFGFGSTGQDVIEFQKRMGITPTGTFDFWTLVALFKFEFAHHLNIFNGIVSPQIRQILNSSN
jgi:hypothetical protein